MRAYEVFLNGKRLCVAGIGSDGYISAYITYRSEPDATWIDVVGLENRRKLYVQWTRKNLRTGDELLLKIVDRKSVDKYKVIRRHDEKRDLESNENAICEKKPRHWVWRYERSGRQRNACRSFTYCAKSCEDFGVWLLASIREIYSVRGSFRPAAFFPNAAMWQA